MFSAEELRFAQKYPFSSTARRIVKEHSFSLENVPEHVQRQAAFIISVAWQGKPASAKQAFSDADLMLAEVQAFPLAKILLSLMKRPELFSRFSALIGKNTFFHLENEKKKNDVLFSLAEDFGIKFSLPERNDALAEISLVDFLKAGFNEQFMKLCNQKVSKGKVFLNQNDFARFLAAFAQKKVFESLPVDAGGAPKQLKQLASELSAKLAARQFKEFDAIISKTVTPAAFPECIAIMYNDLLAGKNLPHLARFDIAVFLGSIGMPKEQIVNSFRKAANFNEKITRYQVEMILQKKYKPVSCAKMREHGIACAADCGYKHPLQYYRSRLKRAQQSEQGKAPEQKKVAA